MSTQLIDEKEKTFKVWSSDRSRRKSFRCPCVVDVVIRTACVRLNVPYAVGMTLILEHDGTEIDDDEVLFEMASETLMLLGPYDIWTSPNWQPAAAGNRNNAQHGRTGRPVRNGETAAVPADDNNNENAVLFAVLRNQAEMQRDLTRMMQQTEALRLYDRQQEREAKRESNNRSLLMTAVGVVAMVGGAAATVAAAPVVAAVGTAAVVGGAMVEVTGLVGYMKSS